VFAPVNAVIDALPAGTVDTLLKPESEDLLTGILTYHIVSGEIHAAGGTANATVAGIEASNGVVHVVDAVLMPAQQRSNPCDGLDSSPAPDHH
jgi:uncharacterized surface protein with fasciclin (FAS1) repeats